MLLAARPAGPLLQSRRCSDNASANSDILILGRHTYETVLGFGEENWPYGDKPLLVMSTQPDDQLRLPAGAARVQNLDEAVRIVHDRGYRNVWVDGGRTICGFLERQLVTEMILTTVPIALGRGIPLFQGIKKDLKLEVVASEVICDLLTTKYRVVYDAAEAQ